MTDLEKKSYAFGAATGSNYVGLNIDPKSFAEGFTDIMNMETLKITTDEIHEYLQMLQREINDSKIETLEEEKNKGRAFLDENRKKEGVHETASGLQYKVLREGNGKRPTPNSSVTVHYHGTLINGRVFDSSVERGESPISFNLNQVISGWTEGLQLMKEGAKYEFYIPSHLAYGDKGAGQLVKGGSTLIFQVELFEVK